MCAVNTEPSNAKDSDMNDGELVKRAAKAAGINGSLVGSGDVIYELGENAYYWNPLNSGDDALRLAIRLDINVHTLGDCVYRGDTIVAFNPDDIYAATRRAITEAAAGVETPNAELRG